MIYSSNIDHQAADNGQNQSPVAILRFNGMQHGRHQQSFFLKEDAVLFVLDGQVNARHGDHNRKLNVHDFVFFKKGTLLECAPSMPQSEMLLFVLKHELTLQFAAMTNKPAKTNTPAGPLAWGDMDQSLAAFCQGIREQLNTQGTIPEPLLSIRGLELMFQLSSKCPVIGSLIMDCRERYIRDIPAMIEEKLMDDVPVPQLARLAGRSLSSFRRDFFSIYNMAPSKWIRQKKLEKAQLLLLNTNLTITEICYTMGFQSNAHFCRIFKSCFGYRPSDTRRQALPS
ncbi:helix-turn-helix domain-containing protein [Paraflavitalea pollutisoli]|uniref:helix-turn-helix domain-containing protein n=1 Tax=Paraflavitalea pollutisoli TaxID=3034143 RepID=UPI0023ECBB37|nr:AraC family transcriptional regulator [Paraflavitalea sp. H1-2-19X]